MMDLMPFRLAPRFSERIWGMSSLLPWYAETGTTELVGEAWLTGPECLVETGPWAGRKLGEVMVELYEQSAESPDAPPRGGEFPLLVKLLFPNQKLSVQVHPNDEQAKAIHFPRGKTECWYVLEAEPGATVMLGLKAGVGAAEVRAAVADGTMEELMEHVPVSVGEMVYVDAGTVHAIGPGVVLLEIQQTSDVTYRLYDYGRPRILHVEQALDVMKTKTRAGKVAPRAMDGYTRLIEEQYFTVDRFDLAAGRRGRLATWGDWCVVGLRGTGTIGGIELPPGRAILVPGSAEGVEYVAEGWFSFARCLAPVV